MTSELILSHGLDRGKIIPLIPHGPDNHAGHVLRSRDINPALNSVNIALPSVQTRFFLSAATRLLFPLLLVAVVPKRTHCAAV